MDRPWLASGGELMAFALFGPAAQLNAAPPEMSDDEVFGPKPTARPVQMAQAAPVELSDDDVFGTPAPAAPSLWDRVKGNARDGWMKGTLAGAGAGLAIDKMGGDAAAEMHAKDKAFEAMPSFMEAPTLGQKILQGSAALTGQVAGAIPSPESFVSLPAKTTVGLGRLFAPLVGELASRIGVKGAEQAVINTAVDPAVQGVNMLANQREAYDPVQTALAPALGFLVGGSMQGAADMAGAFRAWRAKQPTPQGAPVPDAAPSHFEVEEFASSPEMAAFLTANGITDPADPRIMQLQDRLATRRQVEAVTVTANRQDAGGSSIPAFHADQARLAAEQEAIANGDVSPGFDSQAGRVPRQPIPETIPVNSRGQGDIGDPAIRAATEKFGAEGGLPVPTQPAATRMTPDEIARSQAKMKGGNPNTAQPPERLITPEGRLPQTPDQVQEQRQAGQAFDLTEQQRASAGSFDTQTAGRPEGVDAEKVVLDDGFPVRVTARSVKDVGGKQVEMATVQRYDPRTGQVDAEAMPYDVPVRQLKTSSYAQEPRRSQDFVRRAAGPDAPEQPRGAAEPITRERSQTYRTTDQDPNQDFPGAAQPGPAEGRSPLPDQPPGPMPGRQRPRGEDEAIRDFEARQRRAANDDTYRPGNDSRAGDEKASTKAEAQDADGRFEVDDRGFVASDKGGPVRFADQKQAAKWVINEGHKKSPDQIFEIENHPSGKGFGVRERGRADPTEPPPSNGPSSQSKPAGGARAAEKGGPPGALPPPREAPQPKASGPKQRPEGSLFDRIRELGGIRDDRGDVRQIMQGFKNERFKKRVVNPDGLHPDKIREALQAEGWFGGEDRFGAGARETGSYPGDDIKDLYDLMDREAGGQRAFHPDSQPTDREMDDLAARFAEEEMDRAGVTRTDSPNEIARKLAEYRASEEAAYAQAEQERAVDDDLTGLDDADWERIDDYGPDEYEPGSDFGAEREAFEDADTRGGRPENEPEGSGDPEARTGEADGGDKVRPDARQSEVPGTQEVTADELKARAGRKDAEERQANPRAYSGKAQKKADEGLFADQSEKNQTDMFAEGDPVRDKFYSNPVGDPDLWRSVARSLSSKFGWAKDEADAWSRHLEGMLGAVPKTDEKGVGALAQVGHALKVAFYSNDGMLRSLSSKHKSPAIREIADLFFAAPRGGGDGAVKQTYFEALNERYGQWTNELSDLLKPLEKMDTKDRDAAMDQIGRLVVNPGAIKAGTPVHDAAAGIGKMLKDILGYMREAGVEVGEIKRGYLPRVENSDRIMADPEGFKKAATKAYIAEGVPPKDARAAAEDWLNRVMLGDIGVHSDSNDFINIGGGTNTPSFTRGRVLSKKADDILGDFYHRNPADILPRYMLKAIRKAEWSRRMGKRDPKARPPSGVDRAEWLADPLGRWKDFKQRIIDDGADGALPDVVQTIKSITGNLGQAATGGTRNFISLARTWSAFAYLSRATFSSLSEPVSVAIRTGNTMDALRAYGNTVRHWVPALRKIGDGKYLEEMAKDLGFIGDAIDQLSMLQRVGNDDNTLLARRLQTNFFRQIGLTQFTESTRVAAMQGGMVFMRRLASDVANKSHFEKMSRNLLAELGVENPDKFAKWVMERDGKPHMSDLLEGGDMGRIYHSALGRFVTQTVMAPTGANRPRYAQHPLGSLFYNLMSFTYAFQKNVLNRVGSMTKDAVNPKSGLTAGERLAHLAPLANLVPLLAVQYGLGEIRDMIFPDPARAGQQPKTTWNKLMTAFSRSGLTGISDPVINSFTSLRYQRDPVIALLGPIYGAIPQALGDVGNLMGERNSPNTNTVERKAARDAYDMVVKPALIAGVTGLAPAGRPLGMALGAAGIFGVAHPAARERAVKAAAGPPLPPR